MPDLVEAIRNGSNGNNKRDYSRVVEDDVDTS
jgi:hypothetical protein